MVFSSWSLDRRWQRVRRPLAVALIAVGAVMLWARDHAPATTVPTVVAQADIAAGDVVGAGDVAVVAWPADSRPPPATADPAAIVGRRAASAIISGEPLTPQRVTGPSSLATAGAGAVALALPVDPLSASGLVRPGDRVDVVGGGSGTPRTLVTGAPVLTVNQEVGTVIAVPTQAAPAVVAAVAADAVALVLAQA
jgi:Flp pilus assembly protein CpaB